MTAGHAFHSAATNARIPSRTRRYSSRPSPAVACAGWRLRGASNPAWIAGASCPAYGNCSRARSLRVIMQSSGRSRNSATVLARPCEMSTPASAMTVTAWASKPCAAIPAEQGSHASPSSTRAHASAIWLRQELPVHTKSRRYGLRKRRDPMSVKVKSGRSYERCSPIMAGSPSRLRYTSAVRKLSSRSATPPLWSASVLENKKPTSVFRRWAMRAVFAESFNSTAWRLLPGGHRDNNTRSSWLWCGFLVCLSCYVRKSWVSEAFEQYG